MVCFRNLLALLNYKHAVKESKSFPFKSIVVLYCSCNSTDVVLNFKSSSLQKCQFDNKVRVFNVLPYVHCMFSLLNLLSSLLKHDLMYRVLARSSFNHIHSVISVTQQCFLDFVYWQDEKLKVNRKITFQVSKPFFLNSYNYFWFKLFQIKFHQFSFVSYKNL